MHRSEITIDLGAIRHNARRLLEALDGAELWAVVKANGYGHGATDVARAALEAGASALCVVTVAEAVELRRELPEARIIVMCPTDEVAEAREARLELVISVGGEIPDDIPVHLKLDTGMGRWGLAELPEPPANVVGLMSHLATADTDPAFAQQQIERFRAATEPYSHLTRHIANSAAALRLPEARFDAARCGIALYGISPFNSDPAEDGLRPALSWRSQLAQVFLLQPGESTGYGRRFVAERPTWIGIVPVGYADGFRRDMTGTEVLVDGEPRRAVGTVSMDAVAVELERELPVGTPVTIVGDGLLIERHAEVAGTIGYEIACGINSDATRARRVVTIDADRFARTADASPTSGRARGAARGAGARLRPAAGRRARARRRHGRRGPGFRARAARARGRGHRPRPRAARARASTQPPEHRVRRGRWHRAPVPGRLLRPRRHAPTLHHVAQPERVVAELARVTRPGGHVLVVDQLAPDDPAAAAALHEFETARDPSHTRLLADGELRELFAANALKLVRERLEDEQRDLERYSISPAARASAGRAPRSSQQPSPRPRRERRLVPA